MGVDGDGDGDVIEQNRALCACVVCVLDRLICSSISASKVSIYLQLSLMNYCRLSFYSTCCRLSDYSDVALDDDNDVGVKNNYIPHH